MRNIRRHGMVLDIIVLLFSSMVVVQAIPDVLGQIPTLPNQIGKPSNLSPAEFEPYALNVSENRSNDDHHANKVIAINFDDSYKSQFTFAKPILDRYGLKSNFFSSLQLD